jgi:hypothetical protein
MSRQPSLSCSYSEPLPARRGTLPPPSRHQIWSNLESKFVTRSAIRHRDAIR